MENVIEIKSVQDFTNEIENFLQLVEEKCERDDMEYWKQ